MTDEVEIWHTVPGWGLLYEVSTHGRVRSTDRVVVDSPINRSKQRVRRYPGKILKPIQADNWYLKVNLAQGKRKEQHMIHVLVMLTFIGLRPKGQYVCHCDGNRANNALSNLRYDTPSKNAKDRYRHIRARKGLGISY